MIQRRPALIAGVLALAAAAALPAAVGQVREGTEYCDRGEENCAKGPPRGPPPRVGTIYPVARFDCDDFLPERSGAQAHVAALNRAFAQPSGAPNPQVGEWRCRRDGSCFSAGGAPLDLRRAGIREWPVVLLFEVDGDCAEFVIHPNRSLRVRRPAPGQWHVETAESQTIGFEILTEGQDPRFHWASFFEILLPAWI